MNIFFLHHDPSEAARSLCDAHVRKMALESAQILSHPWKRVRDHENPDETSAEWAAARGLAGVGPYRQYRASCQLADWAASSLAAYSWLLDHGIEIAAEFQRRYRRAGEPDHASLSVLLWLKANVGVLALPDLPMSKPPLVMPPEYQHADPVASYRSYYLTKARFARWERGRPAPDWWQELAAAA